MQSIGGALILFCAVGCAWLLCRAERRRLASLAAALEIVRHARRKIELFSTPVASLFAADAPRLPEDLLSALRTRPLAEALAPLARTLGEDGEILVRFGAGLGGGYREDALALCADTEAALTARYAQVEKAYPARRKLCAALPLLTAFAVLLYFV